MPAFDNWMHQPKLLHQRKNLHIITFFQRNWYLTIRISYRVSTSSANLFWCSYKHKQPGSFRASNVKFRSKHIKLTCWKSWQNDLLVVWQSPWYSHLDWKSIQRFVLSLFLILFEFLQCISSLNPLYGQLNLKFKIQKFARISFSSMLLSEVLPCN